MPTLDEFEHDVVEWFRSTILPQSNAHGTFLKTEEEFLELKEKEDRLHEVLGGGTDCTPHEYAVLVEQLHEEAADVFIAFLAWCSTRGIDLVAAGTKKMERNRKRTWGPPNSDGVRRHI